MGSVNSGFAKTVPFSPDRAKAPRRGLYRLFIRDWEMATRIGVTLKERAKPQTLRLHIDIQARDSCAHCGEDPTAVVCYSDIAKRVRRLVRAEEPAVLLEALAEKIAAEILRDPRVLRLTLRLEKPDVLSGEGSVGIEIERGKGDFSEDMSTAVPPIPAP